jgi:endonuclease YncB( thermonuclease family)
MMRWWDGILGIAIAACGCCCAAAQGLAQDADPNVACGGETIAHATVSRIIDGRTFVLDGGQEVRLAAIEVPPLSAAGTSATAADAAGQGAAAKSSLDALVGGDEVVLRRAGTDLDHNLDRYGRMVTYAYAVRDGTELFAQGELLAAGFAQVAEKVAERAGSKACAAELLGAEKAARQAKLGLWADPYYEVLPADRPADVLARRGRFALVEGQVVSVHESGPTIYVNFGRLWSESFAVTISKRNERNFTAAGLDLKALAGRRVRVRGWVEAHREANGGNGSVPWIEAARPEQIEETSRN